MIFICFLSQKGIADAYFNILYNKYLNEYLNEMYQAVTNDNTQSSDYDVRQMHFEAKEKAIKQVYLNCISFEVLLVN